MKQKLNNMETERVCSCGLKESEHNVRHPFIPKDEIVGYRLKPHIDRYMVDKILNNAMPIWNAQDKSVYFIRGHIAGCLVAKLKELQVLNLWFTPIYESEEVQSDWVKENHLTYYYKEGMMKNKETLEGVAETQLKKQNWDTTITLPFNAGFIEGFQQGAKWQQEQDSTWFDEYQKLENYIINRIGDNFLNATPEQYETPSEATIALLEDNWKNK